MYAIYICNKALSTHRRKIKRIYIQNIHKCIALFSCQSDRCFIDYNRDCPAYSWCWLWLRCHILLRLCFTCIFRHRFCDRCFVCNFHDLIVRNNRFFLPGDKFYFKILINLLIFIGNLMVDIRIKSVVRSINVRNCPTV